MKKLLVLLALTLVSWGQDVRFRALDIHVDAGADALAVYQIEILAKNALIAGVEGGEPEPYKKPPYYDTKALQGGRIVLGAFTTNDKAPRGKVRVARIHMMEQGNATYLAKVVVAAKPGGARIAAKVEVIPVGEKR